MSEEKQQKEFFPVSQQASGWLDVFNAYDADAWALRSNPARRRPIFWLAVFFIVGIVLDYYFEPTVNWIGAGALSLILVIAAVVLSKNANRDLTTSISPSSAANFLQKRRTLFFSLGLLASLMGGLAMHALQHRFPDAKDVRVKTPVDPALTWIEGDIVSVRYPATEKHYERWEINVQRLGAEVGSLSATHGKIQVGIKNDEVSEHVFREGDSVRMLVRLEQPADATLPYSFDYAKYLSFKKIYRVGVTKKSQVQALGKVGWLRLDLSLRRWSGAFAQEVQAQAASQEAGLFSALIFGRREWVPREDRQAFANAGTAHLLAISGLHVQLVALILWVLFARIGFSRRKSAAFVLGLIIFFAMFTGANPPVVRATLMIGVFVGAILFRRELDVLSALGAAAILILAFCPGEVFTAGFQLSFVAVFSLATLLPLLERCWNEKKFAGRGWLSREQHKELLSKRGWERKGIGLAQWFRRLAFASFVAWIGTAPIVLYHMGMLNWSSVFTNLIAVPIATLALFVGIAGIVFCLATKLILGSLSLTGLAICLVPFRLLLGFNRWVGEAGWFALELPKPPLFLCLVFFAFLIWIWVFRPMRKSLTGVVVLPLFALLILTLSSFFTPKPIEPQLTFYALRYGRAALLQTPEGGSVLIDCGGRGEGRQLVSNLSAKGVKELSLLIITEDSQDSIGGALEIAKHVNVRRVILPRSAVPSSVLRKFELFMKQAGIPFGPAEKGKTLWGPGAVSWKITSDYAQGSLPRKGSEALAIWIKIKAIGATGVTESSEVASRGDFLLIPAGSSKMIERFLRQPDLLSAKTVCLYGVRKSNVPWELSTLLKRANPARVVMVDSDFEGSDGGLNLEEFAQTNGVNLLKLHNLGSVRADGGQSFYAYKAGKWHALQKKTIQ